MWKNTENGPVFHQLEDELFLSRWERSRGVKAPKPSLGGYAPVFMLGAIALGMMLAAASVGAL